MLIRLIVENTLVELPKIANDIFQLSFCFYNFGTGAPLSIRASAVRSNASKLQNKIFATSNLYAGERIEFHPAINLLKKYVPVSDELLNVKTVVEGRIKFSRILEMNGHSKTPLIRMKPPPRPAHSMRKKMKAFLARPVVFSLFRSVALALVCIGSLPLATAEYPAETKAIAIPQINDLPLTPGPFDGTIESLKQYRCPDWFRDAKFGIWAHWGPQSVGEDGDWYAREMYDTGSDDYKDHLKVYGHPSVHGYKDILPLWKAQKWDPDHLLALYKLAGAHYFVAQAVHHDNFDNWDSKYHRWNSVRIGPHRDMIADWQKATLKQGLHFGVSEHLAASFKWFQTSHGMDKDGPFAGRPYDGNNPAFWDLYHPPADPNDQDWHSHDPDWIREWYARIYDLVTTYKPDLLYSDGGMPYHEVGRRLVSEFYNENILKNGGKLEAVYNCKDEKTVGPGRGEYIPGTCVLDLEKGGMRDIQPYPFQTDTSVGNWFYDKHDKYKSTATIIHDLVDTVSKNGNLLLNVLLYPDGSLPPAMKTFLREMSAWVKINGEAIFGTRPWLIYGEGPTEIKGGSLNENFGFQAADIRFTARGDTLYATTLGLPSGSVLIRALGTGSPLVTGSPTEIALLGLQQPIKWTRTGDGLILELPTKLPCREALCFRIIGFKAATGLTPEMIESFRDTIAEEAKAKKV